ncbi:MAG: glycoside hydrolase family 16 protein [Dysgonamonadaceae bacterium]|jgi:beta-glucanase (GH16 family)|nr:glycoside hydrolase family 16 protein [Dysgonamonadaceae bacterium]
MNKILYGTIIIFAAMAACGGADDPIGPTPWPSGDDDKPTIEKYKVGDQLKSGTDSLKLVWADEFNTNGMVNTSDWTYEKGFVRNQEIQYYTENRSDNCKIEGGYLIITGRKESTSFGSTDYSDGTYTSASIITNKKHSWQYGRFEIKAKIPAGKGPWPAFWAKGDSQNSGAGWPLCGEIDIMEYAAKGPTMIQNVIYGENSSNYKQATKRTEKNFSDKFYVYTLDWSENRLVFAIDNIVTHVVDISTISPNPFRQKFSILLNLALGASTERTLGGKLDPSCLPVEFRVDYVRIYQPK